MAESTLSLAFEDLSRSTAFYLGYGEKATTGEGLTSAQSSNVQSAMKAGYRRFLLAHRWGFLSPRATMTLWDDVSGTTGTISASTTVTATTSIFHANMIGRTMTIATVGDRTITAYTSGTSVTVDSAVTASAKAITMTADGTYRLPDDFGSMFSTQIMFAVGDDDERFIDLTSEHLVVAARQRDDGTGRPTIAGLRPLSLPSGSGQRFDLCVYPVPDDDYSVSFRYNVHPDALTASQYPYGGMRYAEAMRLFCEAAAEEKFRNYTRAKRDECDRVLAQAIQQDIQTNRSERLGVSAERRYRRTTARAPGEWVVGATVHGVTYD